MAADPNTYSERRIVPIVHEGLRTTHCLEKPLMPFFTAHDTSSRLIKSGAWSTVQPKPSTIDQ